MKKRKQFAVELLVLSILFSMSAPASAKADIEEQTRGERRYTSLSVQNWQKPAHRQTVWTLSISDSAALHNGAPAAGETVRLKEKDTLSFSIPVKENGKYRLAAEYRAVNPKAVDSQMSLTAGEDEPFIVSLPVLWADKTAEYPVDRYGNDLPPEQAPVEEFAYGFFEDCRSLNRDPVVFEWGPGDYAIQFSMDIQSLELRSLALVKVTEAEDYAAYREQTGGRNDQATGIYPIEGERYSLKSNSFLRGKSVANAALSPYDTYKKKINTIDGNSWDKAGQKILWEFSVPQSGYYRLAFCYNQSQASNKPVFRRIEIDGALPFKELDCVAFPQNNADSFENMTVEVDGKPVEIWLEAGTHTIAMRASMGPMADIYKDILTLMDDINALGMDLQKLTAGQIDKNRTWDMEVYLPEAIPEMKTYITRIEELYSRLEEASGNPPTFAASLHYAVRQLKRLIEVPRTLPNHAGTLHTGDNSVVKSLGQVVGVLESQPLSLERLYVYAPQEELPKSKASLFTTIAEFFKRLFASFTDDYSGYQPGKDKSDLRVWINRPIQYVEILQQLVDAKYNAVNGTDIKLSIMPNEQKLILAGASGTSPDVALGVNYYTPFEFAIRGAAKNLLEYEGFLPFYHEQYNLEALVPLCCGDGVYGAVETQDFQVLFYRKDLLDMMGQKVPDTWEDVKRMMPVLLRNSMNFGFPIASGGAFKTYHVTSPYIYQNHGSFYAYDGASTAIDEDEAMAGFKEMTELFTIYGGQSVVANFYNSFRFSEIPIGIGNFSTYMQMQTAAPELVGRWDIALCPGTKQDDGSVLRYQVANSTACMIFESTKKSEEAGKFLMWWLAEDTQLAYANLLKSSYGAEYSWNTANLNAFRQMDYPEEHKEVILRQWQEQKENLRHPANYMVEREVSNIWNNVVVGDKSLVEAVDRAVIRSDREILRKLQEFGYVDENGRLIRAYTTAVVENLRSKLQTSSERGGN